MVALFPCTIVVPISYNVQETLEDTKTFSQCNIGQLSIVLPLSLFTMAGFTPKYSKLG